jgi:hypothetical protein
MSVHLAVAAALQEGKAPTPAVRALLNYACVIIQRVRLFRWAAVSDYDKRKSKMMEGQDDGYLILNRHSRRRAAASVRNARRRPGSAPKATRGKASDRRQPGRVLQLCSEKARMPLQIRANILIKNRPSSQVLLTVYKQRKKRWKGGTNKSSKRSFRHSSTEVVR